MIRSALAHCHSLIGRALSFGIAIAMAGTMTAPSYANSAATAASDSFRISPNDLKDNNTALGRSDPSFRALHSNWGKASGNPTKTEVSVPSIDPVGHMRLTSGFGPRRSPIRGASRNHKGIDIGGPIGTPIIATADGVVGRAKWLRGYGKYIEIEHGNELQTRYAHLSAMNVRFGQRVKKGDVIGYMGSTGNSTGSHLHYEVRIGGIAVNPMAFLAPPVAKAKQLIPNTSVDTKAMGGSSDE